eukprot:198672_1
MSSFLNIRSLLFGVSAICETQKEMLLLYIVLGLCCATIPQLTDIPTTNIPINNPMNGYIEIEASSNAYYIYLISPNYTVSVTDQFMLQYAEAYARYSASDNIGVGYASVYFLYSTTDSTSNPTVCGHGSGNPSTDPT